MATSSVFRRISIPLRVAAWILVLGSVAVLVDLLHHIADLNARGDALVSGTAAAFGLAMFGYVAVTGRSPAILVLIENRWNSCHGVQSTSYAASRVNLLCWIVTVVAIAGLVAEADANGLFSDDIRGLVLLISAMAAVAFVVLVWAFARLPPNTSLERTRDR